MKYPEFLIEISKAFKTNNRVAILELIVNEPFHARKSITEEKDLRESFINHAKKDSFFREVLAAGRHPHVGELTSVPAHIVTRIIDKREFYIYCAGKIHVVSDFLSTSKSEPGMMQAKNCGTIDDDLLIEHFGRNRNITDFMEIFTNNNKVTEKFQGLKNPEIRIVSHEDVPKVSTKEIEEMLEEFDNQKSSYIEIKKEQAKPLWEKHKRLVQRYENIPEDADFEFIKSHNLRAEEAAERELLLEEYKKVENVKYRK